MLLAQKNSILDCDLQSSGPFSLEGAVVRWHIDDSLAASPAFAGSLVVAYRI